MTSKTEDCIHIYIRKRRRRDNHWYDDQWAENKWIKKSENLDFSSTRNRSFFLCVVFKNKLMILQIYLYIQVNVSSWGKFGSGFGIIVDVAVRSGSLLIDWGGADIGCISDRGLCSDGGASKTTEFFFCISTVGNFATSILPL